MIRSHVRKLQSCKSLFRKDKAQSGGVSCVMPFYLELWARAVYFSTTNEEQSFSDNFFTLLLLRRRNVVFFTIIFILLFLNLLVYSYFSLSFSCWCCMPSLSSVPVYLYVFPCSSPCISLLKSNIKFCKWTNFPLVSTVFAHLSSPIPYAYNHSRF